MKKIITLAAIAMMAMGSAAIACDTCGCAAKKGEKKADCAVTNSQCSAAKAACPAGGAATEKAAAPVKNKK